MAGSPKRNPDLDAGLKYVAESTKERKAEDYSSQLHGHRLRSLKTADGEGESHRDSVAEKPEGEGVTRDAWLLSMQYMNHSHPTQSNTSQLPNAAHKPIINLSLETDPEYIAAKAQFSVFKLVLAALIVNVVLANRDTLTKIAGNATLFITFLTKPKALFPDSMSLDIKELKFLRDLLNLLGSSTFHECKMHAHILVKAFFKTLGHLVGSTDQPKFKLDADTLINAYNDASTQLVDLQLPIPTDSTND